MIKLEKVSFKTLKMMNARDRINAIQDPKFGTTLAAALTPSEIASLFPRYFLEGTPDVSGFMKAIPSSVTRARQEFYDQQIQQAASGTTRPLAGKPGGWLEKFREKVSTATVVKKPTLTSDQEEVINQIKTGQVSVDDPKAAFLKKIPSEKLKEFNIEQAADEKGNKVYKAIPVTVSKEDVERRVKEESSEVGKHAALKALIAKKEHGVEGDAAYDTIYNFGKGVEKPPKAITEMTIAEVLAYQHDAKAKAGSAAFPVGKYQFVERTLRNLARENNLDPNTTVLTKEMQEKFANQLIEKRGSNPTSLMDEWDGLKRFSSDKEITAAMEIDKNAPALDPKLSDKQKFDKMRDAIVKETDDKVKARMAEFFEQNAPKGSKASGGFPDWVTERSKRELSALNQEFVTDLLEASKRTGIKFNVTQGMRSVDEAARNAASGRGVRNSQHLYGAAADIKILDENGNPVGHDRRDLYEKFARAYESSSSERGGKGRWLGHSQNWSHDIWHFDQGLGYGQTHERKPYGDLKPTASDVGETLKETSPPRHPFGEKAYDEKQRELEAQKRVQEQKPEPPKIDAKVETGTPQAPKTEDKPSEPTKPEPPKAEPAKVETPIEAKAVKSISVKAEGGKVDLQGETKLEAKPIESLKGDNTVVVDQNDTPKFTMNTEKEAAVYDPMQRNVDIIPSQRIDVGGLDRSMQQATQPNIVDEFAALAEDLRKEFTTMISDQDKQKPRPVTMTVSDRDPNFIENLGVVKSTPSATRAFSRSRFVETGDAKDDFHNSLGNPSLT